jgi:hypothetical protein
MTICVAVKVAEGLVIAADSAVVLEGVMQTPQGPVQTILQNYEYANKVTHFRDYPIGILSWGLGSISARSIQSLIMEFEYTYPMKGKDRKYAVKRVAEDFLEFISKRYEAAYPIPAAGGANPVGTPPAPIPQPERPTLGFFIGGYSHREFFGEEYIYEFPNSTGWREVRPNTPDGNPSFGANWYGMTDALTRLILGFDAAALSELINRGANQAIVQKWVDDHVSHLPLVFDGMPLQDAIDFAEYAIQVVIGRFRFGLGPPLCGGDVDIAVITPDTFRWAKRKQWGIHHE